MFLLDSTDGGTAMFAKGQKAESDIELWHKRIVHVNYQWLQGLQSKQVKPASSGSNTDFPSPMSETGAGTSST